MKGLQVACLYSLGCPELKRMKAQKHIFDFIENPQREKFPLIKEFLEELEPFLFYQLIGLQNDITDFFHEDVVRAYWLGNSLSKPLTKKDIDRFLSQKRNFEHHRFHLIKILELVGGRAHHNFESLWLIKGMERGRRFPPKFLENLNDCLMRAGEVIEIGKLSLKVKTKSIGFSNQGFILEDSRERTYGGLVKEIEKGNFISIHLGMAREKIQRETAENLLKITEETISFFKGAE